MPAAEPDERADLVASIAQKVEQGTYDVSADDVARAIMSGPLVAYLRRLGAAVSFGSAESAERNNGK